MAHWVMVIDLEKCTGCQTCAVACKVEKGLGPLIQRVTIIEKEVGQYPDVKRMYIPKRCMNCEDPACVEVCPSGATVKRDDGIVSVDQDKCIGCRYCIMACPYNARTFVAEQRSYHDIPSVWEKVRYAEHTIGVVDKCDFCCDRIDDGLAKGQVPGKDQDATPACVISCIAKALDFGDLDDKDSVVNRLIRERGGFRLLEEMETHPSVYYLPRRY